MQFEVDDIRPLGWQVEYGESFGYLFGTHPLSPPGSFNLTTF